MKQLVNVENLTVKFGDFYAVNNISFKVTQGEIFGFLGANGAGKTTTIRVLCGLLRPTAGIIVINGKKISAGQEQVIKKMVGYMSQRFTLYDDLTIEENLSFAASLRQLPNKFFQKRKKQLLDFISFNKDQSTIVSELPGGLKQEIALVAAMLHDPIIIFLDEPTAGVAPVARIKFWELIRQLSTEGKTVFVTTHYMDEAENCSRIALMRAGNLIALDEPANLKKMTYQQQMYSLTPKNQEAASFITANSNQYFSMFEPYGMHFHILLKPNLDKKNTLAFLSEYCLVKEIEPSLEDVFVKLVEGATR